MKDKDVSLREYVQALIEAEAEIRRSERDAAERAVDKALSSAEKIAERHNEILADIAERDQTYVTERMYSDRHSILEQENDRIRERMDKMEGGRRALSIVAAIVVTVILAAFGLVYGHQLSSSEVAAQIQTEAPWLQDKPNVTRDIQRLQTQVGINTRRLDSIESLDKFFCQTRTQARLPGCSP